ncbi:MAG: helix-turn-helix domain-containing protein [Pontiellaceae bacterium]|jgi:cytoskeletal protein RodZ|nr:helix-turn-helix domain-containing protein [Pontiellaceae bacterium]
MATLGQQLKAAREAKGISPNEAGSETKILTRLIVAMEAENFSSFAAPAYAKGFIRLYAEYLRIDPEPLIAEYIEKYAPSTKPPVNEAGPLQKITHPASPVSPGPKWMDRLSPRTEPPAPETDEKNPEPELQDRPRRDSDIRLLAGIIAVLIVLTILILIITNCSRRIAAAKDAPQVEAARKLLNKTQSDPALSNPEKVERSR